mmetsp:Transcript_7819/g.17974  ORF Transcript_7819/g.17974 Transcript_7819/m.17974 type:complete len:528 (+) Transcript_7819:62-1645(+)
MSGTARQPMNMSDNQPKTGASSSFGRDHLGQGGRLESFDDGHIPETQRGENSPRPRIVRYETEADNAVHVYDGLLQNAEARMLYEATHNSKKNCATAELQGQEEPWGTYVTTDEVVRWMEWKQHSEGVASPGDVLPYADYVKLWRQSAGRFFKCSDLDDKGCSLDMEDTRHLLAVETVAKFFLETIPKRTGCVARADTSKDAERLFSESEFRSKAHGVAVWALSSTVGNAVQYHIDYAELLRYEQNVIVPPLWAGTCQVSTLRTNAQPERPSMRGGEFCVNLRGLDHYSDHGYKGSKSGDPMGGWRRPTLDSRLDSGVYVSEDSWVTIPYAHCRGIAHCGELPHLSSPIESIDDDCISRVIIGFNVFGHDVGHLVSKAPEHSKTFRRKVKLYRSTLATPTSHASGMKLSQIRNNKGLTKLLVLAKREKIKAELRVSQERLTRGVWERLLGQDVAVSTIVSELSRASEWPRKNDVHAHVNHMIYSDPEYLDSRSGKRYRIVFGRDCKENKTTRGSLVSLSASLSAVEV